MTTQDAPSRAKVAGVVAFYMSAALLMVFANKVVLNSAHALPFTFLFIQLAIAVVLLHVLSFVSPSTFQIPQWDLQKVKNLTLLVIVGVTGFVFNTLCLRDVDVSFFQIARGMVLPFTILITVIPTRSTPQLSVIAAAAIVTVGFIVGVTRSSDAIPVSPLAIVYGFLSSFMTALHAVLIKSSLPHVNNSPLELAYWGNAGSALLLVPLVLINGEVEALQMLVSRTVSGDGALSVFAIGCLVTGVTGFLLCISTSISIKVTSPVTHMFSSAGRCVIQTLFGIWIFGDIITVKRASSILVILLGTLYYTWIKSLPVPSSTQSSTPASSSHQDIEAQKSDAFKSEKS